MALHPLFLPVHTATIQLTIRIFQCWLTVMSIPTLRSSSNAGIGGLLRGSEHSIDIATGRYQGLRLLTSPFFFSFWVILLSSIKYRSCSCTHSREPTTKVVLSTLPSLPARRASTLILHCSPLSGESGLHCARALRQGGRTSASVDAPPG